MNRVTAVIFGGSSGIGEAAALRLFEKGHRVIIVGRSRARLEAARERIDPAVEIASVDATNRAAVKTFFEHVGPFEHLVLSFSGGKGAGPFRSLEVDEVRDGMECKFFAQLAVAQSALGSIAASGSMTFVSAGSARVALPGTVGLAAINGAIEAIVPTLAKELAPIRVNAVSPGVIDTPWWDTMPAPAKASIFEQSIKRLPVRRVGRPDDVAAAIVYLAENTFVTGTVMEVDGGAQLT